jgi:DegV family protein with EDD domain
MKNNKNLPHLKIRYLDGTGLKNAILTGIEVLKKKQRFLNKINVFPIPDRDTGTNMVATLNGIFTKINHSSDYSISVVSSLIAESALAGAQGYSGIILAQFLNGFAKGVEGKEQISTNDFAQALQKGQKAAYATLDDPVEGTILTVIKDWSNSVARISRQVTDFKVLLMESQTTINQSLKDTTKKLLVLKEAKVADAGAQGFVYLFEGMLHYFLQGKTDRLAETDFKHKFSSKSKSTNKKNKNIPSIKKARIGIVTDSSCDLPRSFLKNHQIDMIPLKISFGPETFLDKVEITPTEFYNRLVSSKQHPKTSQPALVDIKRVYDRVVEKYDTIISIHLPRVVSGTLKVIEKAAQKYGEKKIVCIDGKTISAALGLIIMEAVEAMNKGFSLEEIIKHINRAIKSIKIFIVLPTVKYLVKGGRLSKPKGILGRALRLKPIVSIDREGNIYLAAKAFGEKNAFKKAFNMAVKEVSKFRRAKFMVAHAHAQKKASWVVDQLTHIFQINDEIQTVEAAPVLGVHAGPGTVGFGFIGYDD